MVALGSKNCRMRALIQLIIGCQLQSCFCTEYKDPSRFKNPNIFQTGTKHPTCSFHSSISVFNAIKPLSCVCQPVLCICARFCAFHERRAGRTSRSLAAQAGNSVNVLVMAVIDLHGLWSLRRVRTLRFWQISIWRQTERHWRSSRDSAHSQ